MLFAIKINKAVIYTESKRSVSGMLARLCPCNAVGRFQAFYNIYDSLLHDPMGQTIELIEGYGWRDCGCKITRTRTGFDCCRIRT